MLATPDLVKALDERFISSDRYLLGFYESI